MAVIQIAKIQVRSGLQENLPTLDTGEFGWSVDERRLYIGNGTLAEGAPEIGNTEILTVYSNNSLVIIVDELVANVTNLQSDVTSIQSNLATLQSITLTNNIPSATNVAIKLNSLSTNIIDYTIVRNTAIRTGTIRVAQYNGTSVFEDEYSETAGTGVTLSFNGYGTSANLSYTTTNTGSNATFKYYLKVFV